MKRELFDLNYGNDHAIISTEVKKVTNGEDVQYTNSNGQHVQVVFDDLHGEVIDSVDHSTFYGIKGYGSDGNEYSATSEFCCGEFEGITDIELV